MGRHSRKKKVYALWETGGAVGGSWSLELSVGAGHNADSQHI